jgi:hypothetical protein
MAVTLASLITQTRQRADIEGSQVVTDSELTGYINSSIKELYDILVSTYEDYYLSETTATVTTGDSITLPTDFYKLRGLDYAEGSVYYQVLPFKFNQRNQQNVELFSATPAVKSRYRVQGSVIKLVPATAAAGTYRVWYIPRATELSLTTDTFDGINGWEEFVIVDAAIKCMVKQELGTQELEKQKRDLIRRIEAMAPNRDADAPACIKDNDEHMYSFLDRRRWL